MSRTSAPPGAKLEMFVAPSPPAAVPRGRGLLLGAGVAALALGLAGSWLLQRRLEGWAAALDSRALTQAAAVFDRVVIAVLANPRKQPFLGTDERVAVIHEALAASLQAVFENAAMHVLRHVQKTTRRTSLCLAGGCAMKNAASWVQSRSSRAPIAYTCMRRTS